MPLWEPDFDGTDPAKALAPPSAGVTVVFDGYEVTGITDLSWKLRGGLSKGRSAFWTDSEGSVSVTYFGSGPSDAQWNTKGVLTISGGGLDLSRDAICGGVSAKASLNGFTTYSVEFSLFS